MAASFTTLYGIYTSLGSVVSSITEPYGYTSVDNSIFGAIFILSGVVGSFIYGMILDRTNRYLLVLRVITISSFLSIIGAMFTLPTKNVGLFAVNLLFVGASVIPVIPISYSFAVELTYPLSEAMSNGMMIMVS